MREKVTRILGLVQAGTLTLEDAAPLLAALNSKLALTEADRELLGSLLTREDLSAEQLTEHLLLLRGVREAPARVPGPPRPPAAPHFAARLAPGRTPGGLDDMIGRITDRVERAVESAVESLDRTADRAAWGEMSERPGHPAGRILSVTVESAEGDEYSGHLPVSLAPHLHKLIPAYGVRALEAAGLSVEALQLLLEAEPAPGELITSEDSEGNSVSIRLR